MFGRLAGIVLVALAFLYAGVSNGAVPDSARVSPPLKTNRLTPLVKAVHAVLPSVVSLSTERIIRAQSPWGDEDPFLSGIQPTSSKSVSLGSGFIIDPSGLILTNAHVIRNASRITVTTYEGKRYEAREIAEDIKTDLALLRLCHRPEREFPCVRFGHTDDILLGETLISMGNPYGLGNSVASGIVSGIGRKALFKDKIIFDDIIQLNIALNPGNSGGPLVNLDAETIGMTLSSFKGAEGISFGIPLSQIREVLSRWLIPENAGEVRLGIVPEADPRNEKVLIVKQLAEGSPSALSGLRLGDRIVEIDGEPVTNSIAAGRKLYHLRAGEEIEFTLADGSSVSVKPDEMPLQDGYSLAFSRLGLGLQPLSKPIANALRYPFSQGVVVSRVTRPGLEIARGDMVLRVNMIPVASVRDIARALQSVPVGAVVPVEVCTISSGENGDSILSRKLLHIPAGG